MWNLRHKTDAQREKTKERQAIKWILHSREHTEGYWKGSGWRGRLNRWWVLGSTLVVMGDGH